jgi:hypothetical protein
MAALIRLVHQYIGINEEQAKARLNGPDCLQIEEMIQGQINKAKEGDSRAFQFIIEIMCGKIPETDAVSPADALTIEEKAAIMRKALATLEGNSGGGPVGSSD